MKKIPILISLIFLLFTIAETTAQEKPKRSSPQIEIMTFKKWDSYPVFNYAMNEVNTNKVKIDGASLGITASYKYPIKNNLYLKGGLGYYQYSFNKINKENRFGKSDTRVIHYPNQRDIIFTTNKYWYNCLSTNIGLEQYFRITKTFQITTGVNFINYYTFSQHYNLSFNYPPEDNRFMQYNKRNFGFSIISSLGLLKSFGRLSLGPFVSAPIYEVWHKDPIFPSEIPRIAENLSSTRDKWFKGIGAGISLNYSLK